MHQKLHWTMFSLNEVYGFKIFFKVETLQVEVGYQVTLIFIASSYNTLIYVPFALWLSLNTVLSRYNRGANSKTKPNPWFNSEHFLFENDRLS